jgi:proline dehydrogenase
VIRSALLWASTNRRMERLVRSSAATRRLVRRFMPGETRADVLRAIRGPTVITYLGENVDTDIAADHSVGEYQRLLAALRDEGADAHISVKLTQLGLDVHAGRALTRLRRLAHDAASHGSTMVIDMESSPYVDATIDAYETVLRDYPNVGLCLQAYLHRTPHDIKRLLPMRPYIRLVKGAYREPPDHALQSRADIDRRYLTLARDLLAATKRDARVAFGTHDLALITRITRIAREYVVAHPDYEVQMLYGIQDGARRRLAAEGIPTRVLISYGCAWYPWFMRRLAEKPSNLLLVARNLG